MTALGEFRAYMIITILMAALFAWGMIKTNPLMVLSGLLFFAVFFGITLGIMNKASDIKNWKRLGLGTAKTCPENKQEWENIRSSGWTERVLVDFAIEASSKFDRRKEYKERYEEILKTAKKPKELPPLRDTLKVAHSSLKLSEKLAQKAMNQFLQTWDLFQGKGVLPRRPKTEAVWTHPNLFREAAYDSYKYFSTFHIGSPPPDHGDFYYLRFRNYAIGLEYYRHELNEEDRIHLYSCEICLEKIKIHLRVNELLLQG